MLPPRFQEPQGFQWGRFQNAAGAGIRYGHISPEGESRGSIVIVTGFRESIEKYFEVAQDMLDRGLDVWMMDWRDQGGSDRYLPQSPQRSYSEGYQEQIDTLRQFAGTIVDSKDKPLFLSAHSMGGHIGLRFLKEHPGVFHAAMLTAPMLDVPTGEMTRDKAERLTSFFSRIAPGKYAAQDASDWNELKFKFENNDKTSDPARFAASTLIYKSNERLRKGDATFAWVRHTFESIRILTDEGYLKSIQTPVLMEISGEERVVLPEAQERAVKLLPSCRRVFIQAARHEIWMEKDEIRNEWLAAFDVFLNEKISAAPKKSPKP